ncbi:MAG: hypothetical protein GWN93_05780 [Deltaproteobacteria bacterium]|nr:hypothetical protein [Deltaproteobacteria bacterium]
MAFYNLADRGVKDFRIRIDKLNRAMRDPLEGVVGDGTVFRMRYRPVAETPTPILYTSGSLGDDMYELDAESGTVVFNSAPSVQPTATYYWSNMTDDTVREVLFAGFHEMEGRWPRRFKLVDGSGNEILYPADEDTINVVDQNGVDPPCGDDTFSTSAVERNLLLVCARYAYLSQRLDHTSEHYFRFREDRGLTVDKQRIPDNIGTALIQAETQMKAAIRSAQAKYFTSGENLGTALKQPGTIDYFEGYEWQTDSRDDDYRTTYAGQ